MKKCKIYYGTVVNDTEGGWAGKGSHMCEPVKVEGREAIGKEPDYCCQRFKGMWSEGFNFHFFSDHRANLLEVHTQGSHNQGYQIGYCPFCGAEIALTEHLKLRVIEEPRTVHVYHVEAIK